MQIWEMFDNLEEQELHCLFSKAFGEFKKFANKGKRTYLFTIRIK
jgi:hypothetical protein